MGINRIDKKSYPYLGLKAFVGFWHNHVFYKRIVIKNAENVPKDSHIIFTGNHQNALMDAMVFLYGTKVSSVFMSRSDIFKNPVLGSILYFLRMLPIFRIRDGYSALKKNDAIFQKTIDVLKNKIGLVIMAEGNHASKRRLRPLKKGFARIAFQTEEANDFKLDIQVVPVGIDYSNYENYRTELLINYGKPIPISDFREAYKEAPAIAINELKDRLAESLKPLMVHIESEKYYSLYYELCEIYKYKMAKNLILPSAKQPHKLKCDQEIIHCLEEFEGNNEIALEALNTIVLRYQTEIKKQKLNYSTVQKEPISFLHLFAQASLFLLALPIFILGWLLNYIPFGIANSVVKKIKDRQFISSIKFAVSLFTYPLFHLLESFIVWIIFRDWQIVLSFYIGMPILGILARSYWEEALLFLKKWRWRKIKRSKKKIYQSIKTDQEEIFNTMKSIVA